MKVLHVIPYFPLPLDFGGAIRIYHMLKNIARSHDVDVIAFGTNEQAKGLRDHFGSLVRNIHAVPFPWVNKVRRLTQLYALLSNRSFFSISTYSNLMQQTINRVLDQTAFDIVQTEFPVMAQYTIPADAAQILDSHNVEYDNFRRMAQHSRSSLHQIHYRQEYQKMHDEEIAVCKKQHAVLCTSERDKAILDAEVPYVWKTVIPNGVDTRYFTPTDDIPEPYSLVFTGTMQYVPNYDGMLYFLDEIFPLLLKKVPKAKIYIVGSSPPKALRARAAHNVIVTGRVDDVRPYVRRSSIYVVPLRMGGGTRLKVLEGMAMKKPIVTTSVGCEGIDVQHGETVYIEDDPASFADRIFQLLRDARTRERLVCHGYELVMARYEWSIIGQALDRAYEEIVKRTLSGNQQSQTALRDTGTAARSFESETLTSGRQYSTAE